MVEIVILGGHGDGQVAAQIIADMRQANHDVRLVGYLNDALRPGDCLAGLPVLGGTADWQAVSPTIRFHICLHKVGQMRERARLIEGFGIPEDRLATIIHPTATIADNCQINGGVMIASHVTCQPGTRIGGMSTVRGGANLGHDTVLGPLSYVGPNATLCGKATLGKAVHIGPNAVVTDGLGVEDHVVLSAGAVLMKPATEGSTWMGNPARRIK